MNKTNFIKYIAIFIVTSGVFLLAIEFYSRLHLKTSPGLWAMDSELGYILASRASGKYGGASIQINSKGIRDYEYPYQKRKGIFRIITLGDSYTYGYGIEKIQDLYPKVIEKRLLEKGYPLEIINLSVGGYNTRQEIKWFKKEGIKYSPDMVVLGFTLDDADPEVVNISNLIWLREHNLLGVKEFLRRNLYSITFLMYRFQKLRKTLSRNRYAYPSPDSGYYDQCIDEIVDFSRFLESQDIKLIVLLFPHLEDLKDYPYRELHDYIAERIMRENIICYDLSQYLKRYREKDLWIRKDNHHPNELCHRYFADFLTDRLCPAIK